MLFTEPRVVAKKHRLGLFADFVHQQRADLAYGGQAPLLSALARRPPEQRPASTIPTPPTPPSR